MTKSLCWHPYFTWQATVPLIHGRLRNGAYHCFIAHHSALECIVFQKRELHRKWKAQQAGKSVPFLQFTKQRYNRRFSPTGSAPRKFSMCACLIPLLAKEKHPRKGIYFTETNFVSTQRWEEEQEEILFLAPQNTLIIYETLKPSSSDSDSEIIITLHTTRTPI